MRYQHTQSAPLYLFLFAFASFLGVTAGLSTGEPYLAATLLAVGILMAFLAMSFRELTVEDQGDWLGIRFGPLPVIGTRLPYSSMTSAEPGKTSLIDGWGIHYLPWRGWTFNLWGFDCVVVRCGNRVIRIGTNDADRLAAFLADKIQSAEEFPS